MADEQTSTYTCSKCKQTKPETEFYKDKTAKRGRRFHCRQCTGKAQAARWARKIAARPPKEVIPDGFKRCPRCKTDKPVASFSKDKIRPDGFKCWCRDCHNADSRSRWGSDPSLKAKTSARNRSWYADHPGKYAEYTGRWRKKNPSASKAATNAYRARKVSAPGRYTADDIADLFRLQKGRCAYCKKRLGDNFDVDHVQPLARGGSNEKSNLQLTCRSCNAKKHARDPLKFARGLGLLL